MASPEAKVAAGGEAKAAAATDAASPSPPRVVPNFDALDLNSVSSSDSELDVEMDGRDDLAASIAAEMRDRDRHLVRRASTRLDYHAIRSTCSIRSMTDMLGEPVAAAAATNSTKGGAGQPLAVDTTNSLAPMPARHSRHSRQGSGVFTRFHLKPPGDDSGPVALDADDLERTVRRTKGPPENLDLESSYDRSHDRVLRTPWLRESNTLLPSSPGRASIRRTMSMVMRGKGSDSKSTERWMRIAYNLLVFVLVFWALFMEDLAIIYLPPSTERFMLVSAWVVFVIFLLELVIFSVLLPGYWRSEQFWMELIAVISLLPIAGHVAADCAAMLAPFEHNGDCGCVPWVLLTAQTINSILQPIRAAAMSNRAANAGHAIFVYSKDLVEGTIEVLTPKTQRSRRINERNAHAAAGNVAAADITPAAQRKTSLDPDPLPSDGSVFRELQREERERLRRRLDEGKGGSGSGNGRDLKDKIGVADATTNRQRRSTGSGQASWSSYYSKDRKLSTATAESGTEGKLAMLKRGRAAPQRTYSFHMNGARKNSVQAQDMGHRNGIGRLHSTVSEIATAGDADNHAKTSMLGRALIQRTNMNVLFGLVIVMPVISLLHTTALNLTPESGLLLLDTALCKGGDVGAYTASLVPHHTSNKNNKNNKTKEELVRAAQSYVSVVTPFDYSDMSRRLPMYRVIDVMLCGLASAFRDESFFFGDGADRNLTSVAELAARYGLRVSELWVIYISSVDGSVLTAEAGDSRFENASSSVAHISLRELNKSQAMLSLSLTCVLLVVVGVWTSAFRRDYSILITAPLQHVIDLLRRLASNPRLAVDFGVAKREIHRQEKMERRRWQRGSSGDDLMTSMSRGSGSIRGSANSSILEDAPLKIHSEIDVIEASIAKFGRLLHVGFGEAGVTIIARNLLHGKFDPVQPGRKVMAIFGFCDIRNFTDCCEVLETEAMIFTNRIAAIVHGCVHASGGDVNKNIGDAFLSVWKLSESFTNSNNPMPSLSPTPSQITSPSDRSKGLVRPSPLNISKHATLTKSTPDAMDSVKSGASVRTNLTISTTASTASKSGRRGSTYVHHLSKDPDVPDKALRSFVDIILLLDRSLAVQMYAKRSSLQKKMGPGFRIRMGFGLHLGWGIEGAIGTRHKIDASYLSPHVNMSARLEAATKQYGVTMLLTDAVKEELLQPTQHLCRPLDRVTVKGSSRPVTLYTYDLSASGKESSLRVPGLDLAELQKMQTSFLERSGQVDGARLLGEDPASKVSETDAQQFFLETWKQGFEAYVSGNWGLALQHFETCFSIRREDSPARRMLAYIWDNAVVAAGGVGAGSPSLVRVRAPTGWPGYRSLNSK